MSSFECAGWETESVHFLHGSYYPSRDHPNSDNPPDDWYSSEGSGIGIASHTGPVSLREVSPGHPAVADGGYEPLPPLTLDTLPNLECLTN